MDAIKERMRNIEARIAGSDMDHSYATELLDIILDRLEDDYPDVLDDEPNVKIKIQCNRLKLELFSQASLNMLANWVTDDIISLGGTAWSHLSVSIILRKPDMHNIDYSVDVYLES
jgi:hypothetical protein